MGSEMCIRDRFIVTRGLFLNAEQSFINEQLSMFISNNFVITMQDSYEDLLESLRNRLRRGKSLSLIHI